MIVRISYGLLFGYDSTHMLFWKYYTYLQKICRAEKMMLKLRIVAKPTKLNGWIDLSAIIMGQYENADIAWEGEVCKM